MDPGADPVLAARFAVASFVGLEEMARTDPSSTGVLGVSPDDYLRLVSRALSLRLPPLD
jgi:hypothetical protein